jgi:hypothetical protein
MPLPYDAHLYALIPVVEAHTTNLHKPLIATGGRTQSLWSHRWSRGAQGAELLKDKFSLSNKITDGPYKKLSFQIHAAHISYLQLGLHDSTKHLSDDNKAVIIKLSKDSCRALEVHELEKSQYEHLA